MNMNTMYHPKKFKTFIKDEVIKVDKKERQEIAYTMQEAYKKTKTQGNAVEKVKDKYPKTDLNILWAMWQAIDAYIEIFLIA